MSTYFNPNKPKALRYDDCPAMLRLFVEYERAIKNRSALTANAYYVELRCFFRYMKIRWNLADPDAEFEDIPVHDITKDQILSICKKDVLSYMFFLADERNNSAETRAHKLIAVRTFFKYMMHEQGMEINPAIDIPMPKIQSFVNKPPIHLNLAEAHTLLDSVSGRNFERNYCIITFLLNLGLRVSELVAIDTDDIMEASVLIRGKGNKERTAYLNDACIAALTDYMAVRESMVQKGIVSEDEYALFVSEMNHGCRITTRSVQKMLRKIVLNAGLDPRCSPHKLRHSAATLLYEYNDNVDIMTLQKFLGHNSPATSEIYVHPSDKRLIELSRNAPLGHRPGISTKNTPE